jgi:broad specificity phosphatase PhoE
MRRLLLARHGQSVSNAARRFQGRCDVALSPLGQRQAEALGIWLHGRRRPIAAIYTSPLQRARHTAEIAAARLGASLTAVEDLRELSLGEWENCTVDEIRARPGDPYLQWMRDPLACPPPGGEPLDLVQARVVRVIEAIQRAHPDGEDVLIVCHGGVIGVYLAHCLALPLSAIWRLSLGNGSVSEVAPPRVLSVNDTGHLATLGAGGGGGLRP